MTTPKKKTEPEKNLPLYNVEIKERFLSDYQGDSKTTYSRMFDISKDIEYLYEKDLYDFNLQLLELVLAKAEPLTMASSKHNGHVLSAYIKWAIKNKYRDNETNPFHNVTKSWFSKFVLDVELFINEKELVRIERDLYNFQDKVIPRLLFEGVGGDGLTELLNLNVNDVDASKRELKLYNGDRKDNNTRVIKVSKVAIDYIFEAAKETQNLKNNGEIAHDVRAKYTKLIPPNGFVIRSAQRKGADFYSPAKIHTIYRRLQMIADQWGKPHFNATNIQRSGMLKMASTIVSPDETMEKRHYDMICKQFDVPKVLNGGTKMDYNYYPLKDFLNMENIERLYFSNSSNAQKKIAL